MKKMVLSFVAASLTIGSAYADGGGGHRSSQKPLKVSEFFCAIAGGATTGVIVKNAGASDPVTFLGALIGGAIGVDFCHWLNDDKNVGAQAAAFKAGLDDNMCGERRWESSHYKGSLKVLAESYTVSGSGGEAGGDNTCKFFETTIQEKSGQYIGRTKAWACKDLQGQWIVTKDNWIVKKGIKTCDNSRLPEEGSVSVGDGRVMPPTPIDIGRIRGNWGLEQFRRHVNDYGIERSLKLARRTRFAGEVEVGVMKALSDDGRGVIIYFSPTRQVVAPIDDVGIECRATELCYDTEVTTRDGLSGTFQYIFRNGDVVVNDINRGIKLRPGSYLN